MAKSEPERQRSNNISTWFYEILNELLRKYTQRATRAIQHK